MMSGRATPQSPRRQALFYETSPYKRHTRNVGSRGSSNVLASLRATQIITSKPVLPAELIATILDYLPVADLLRCARVSHRLQEMVYDDTRWIQKLRAIGVWDEREAKQRVEDAMKRKAEAQRAREVDEARRTGARLAGSVNGIAGGGRQQPGQVTLFDMGIEEDKLRKRLEQSRPSPTRGGTVVDGFDDLTIASLPNSNQTLPDPDLALNVLDQVRSIRGRARQEFGKIYGALGTLYLNLASSTRHSDPMVFRTYRDPEQQAKVLSALKRFSRCDNALGWSEREQRLASIISVFENAVLREFEHGFSANDITGRMHRYAHVLTTLNGGASAVDYFISHHPVMSRDIHVGNPLDCLEGVASGHVDLNPARMFFENLANKMVEQAGTIDQVFPENVDVLTPFLSRLCEDVVADYLTTLFDEAHRHGSETYVKAVAGTFEQALRFVASLQPTKVSPPDFAAKARLCIQECYERHFDLYLSEELSVFKRRSKDEVDGWEKDFSDQEASRESFFMSNLNRQEAKRDFLTSFKKVIMMPVNVLPAFNTPKAVATQAHPTLDPSANPPARLGTPTTSGLPFGQLSGTSQPEAPSTELAAKAAIMNSRLEGIRTLFSIEVALNLTHFAKASIERLALVARNGGRHSDEAKEQCNVIFIAMLAILGDRHVKNGFDKAVQHLSNYNPQEVRKMQTDSNGNNDEESQRKTGVEPLVTFLELVNVGDLIQQMIDVFFAQELVATKLTDNDDFLNPAIKDKKRFEQMLDERVAAGLNRGIGVLMDEIDFICATTQLPTDFNPGVATKDGIVVATVPDIGPSKTARDVVEMVGSHTSMLVGSTDKNMLDVFTQEVGLRLFGVLCKHFKRQRISVDGAINFISDINHYSAFVASLRQKPLLPYFQALREMSQIYLVYIDPPGTLFSSGAKAKRWSTKSSSKTAAQAKELAVIIADSDRYRGIFPSEEVYEFAERRADWYLVKTYVESALYGVGCSLM